ncbi:DUF4865 family protein [Peterkaempfera griseoplana]|uniref:DUF4865 family protein n=1 Tax=Peterkaempfera griseoplana TaxID=66896 RepID=UPI0006E1DC59|nr:DUF4865 family protein [Peterkaempfera griseoplana]
MHAMQYEITLPADYDMGIIHQRVARRGHLLDDFAGLGLKAYCVRERGVDGSPVNQYAPFYLWTAPEGMNRFLWGPGFGGIREDFGRPVVQHWTGLGFHRGPAWGGTPRAAARQAVPVSADADPARLVEEALNAQAKQSDSDGLHSSALAVDPRTWELLHFTLWAETIPDDLAGARYAVHHLSTPEADTLAVGRHW